MDTTGLYPFRDVFSPPKGGGGLGDLGFEDLEFYGINTAVAKEGPDFENKDLPKIHYKVLQSNAKARHLKDSKIKQTANSMISAGAHEKWDDSILNEAKTFDYKSAKKFLTSQISFPRETDYDVFLLSLAQTYIKDLMPRVFYLAFEGPKSAGKSSATSMWAYLADETYQAGQITAAVLANIMEKAHGLALDEADKLNSRDDGDVHMAILRQGTDKNSPYMKMREVMIDGVRVQEMQQIKTYGPKCFNFTKTLEDALMSRADVIHMVPRRVAKLRRRTRHFRSHLAPLKAWLEECGRQANEKWDAKKIREYEGTVEFEVISDSMNPEVPRYGEIGDLMTIVAKVFEWDTEGAIPDRINGLLSTIDDEVEEVRVAILDTVCKIHGLKLGDYSFVFSGGDGTVSREDVRSMLNKNRKGAINMGSRRFNELLKELGFLGPETREKGGARRRTLEIDADIVNSLLFHQAIRPHDIITETEIVRNINSYTDRPIDPIFDSPVNVDKMIEQQNEEMEKQARRADELSGDPFKDSK
jgi:hypothetical protein